MSEFFKKKKQVEEVEDKVAKLSEYDISLKAFKEKAQEDLQYLIDFMESHEKDDELFKYAIKADFVEDGNSEHMWVQTNEFKGGYFLGKLANKPNTIKALKYGDEIKVKREDVEDWILRDDLTNTKVGGFSSGYIRDKSKQV